MTNHSKNATRTSISRTTRPSTPDPAPQDDEPHVPLLRRPWFKFVMLIVLALAVCLVLFLIWGLPIVVQLINDVLQDAGLEPL